MIYILSFVTFDGCDVKILKESGAKGLPPSGRQAASPCVPPALHVTPRPPREQSRGAPVPSASSWGLARTHPQDWQTLAFPSLDLDPRELPWSRQNKSRGLKRELTLPPVAGGWLSVCGVSIAHPPDSLRCPRPDSAAPGPGGCARSRPLLA